MTIEEAIEIVRREWDSQGGCASCGWRACLYEYGDLADAIHIDEAKQRIELSCLGDDDSGGIHQGVRIYYSSPLNGVDARE